MTGQETQNGSNHRGTVDSGQVQVSEMVLWNDEDRDGGVVGYRPGNFEEYTLVGYAEGQEIDLTIEEVEEADKKDRDLEQSQSWSTASLEESVCGVVGLELFDAYKTK